MAKTGFPPLLHLTYDLQQMADNLLFQETGVGLSQIRIMSGLSYSVPRSQKYLAVKLSQTEANISRQLQVMKDDGLVSIEKNKKDGRQRDILLTPKGQNIYTDGVSALSKRMAKFNKDIMENNLHTDVYKLFS